VLRFVRQASHSAFYIRPSESPEHGGFFTDDEFGKGGAGGDRGGAASHFVAGFFYLPVLDQNREPEDVAADRVRDFDGDGG